ncbi:hypothetical protein A9K75_06735 [Campylobacter fetus subsp. testudinum]|uniref:hypothetical protein n=1 Tax=Campylobacter fetus TaxID=196 RepID=UPI0008189D83|nr:hypothetical protein [Campylobacter fetus]OCR99561.1 hypothetical protein A9K75_06735 [Campylobacter fetus subsp. testudinum]
MGLKTAYWQILTMRKERKEEEKYVKQEQKEALMQEKREKDRQWGEIKSMAWKIFRNKNFADEYFSDQSSENLKKIKKYGIASELYHFIVITILLSIVWNLYQYMSTLEYIEKQFHSILNFLGQTVFPILFLVLLVFGLVYKTREKK